MLPWVLIHSEVQTQRDLDFAERMFGCHYRIRDRFPKEVVGVAILGDDVPT